MTLLAELGNDGFVEACAQKVFNRTPHSVDLDDLLQEGYIALLDAHERYDPSRGTSFKSFAYRRVNGAMLDYLRRQDWMGDRQRRRLNAGEEIIEPRLVELIEALVVSDGARPQDEVVADRKDATDLLAGFDQRTARMLYLHYVEGLYQREVALLYRVTEGRVNQILNQAARDGRS